jgi:porphobilinogen deaminase
LNSTKRPITIATRGSALALAQANAVLAQCRAAFPKLTFDLKIIKTTGDKLQRASIAKPDQSLPKGLFTKELEVALLKNQADLAVHSLKDLPTDLPAGLKLGAVSKRADVRDVLIYRDSEYLKERATSTTDEWRPGQGALRGFNPHTQIRDFPNGATVATSSNRRKAQLLALRPDVQVVEIRGNVVTRLQKLADKPEIDALVLAAAGLERLNFRIALNGHVEGDAVPDGLLAVRLKVEEMLPCIGQAALGIEIRADDERMASICERLNHFKTYQCASAERAFLRGMGGGCQTPVAAYAESVGHHIRMRAVSFIGAKAKRAEGKRPIREAEALGEQLAGELRA